MAGAVRGVLLLAQKRDIGTNHKRKRKRAETAQERFFANSNRKAHLAHSSNDNESPSRIATLVYRHELDEEPYYYVGILATYM